MAEYHVEFDTQEMAGRLLAVRVRLDREIIRDMNRKVNIALCNDPLYPALERYVRANPSGKCK